MLNFVKVEEVISLGLIVDINLNWDTCMLPRCWKKVYLIYLPLINEDNFVILVYNKRFISSIFIL